MNDTYVECLVKVEPKAYKKFFKYLLIILTAIIGLLSLATGILIGFILAIVLGVIAYFVSLNTDIEYEYLYVDRQITVDKIMLKSKRKRVGVYDVDKIEAMGPINSYQLDNFKNRQTKNKDFSCGVEKKPDHRYAVYYEGQEKLIIEPSPEFVKAIYNIAPRKVFTN